VHTPRWRVSCTLTPSLSRVHPGSVDRMSFCGRGGTRAVRPRLATDLIHQPPQGGWAACGRERRKEKVERRVWGGVGGEVGGQPGAGRLPVFSHAGGRPGWGGRPGLPHGMTWGVTARDEAGPRRGRPRGGVVEDGHAAGGQTWRFVPTGARPYRPHPFHLPRPPGCSSPDVVSRERGYARGGAAG